MRWSQQALPHCVLCFRRLSDEIKRSSHVAPVNVNTEVINVARQILRAQTHHVNALES